MYVTAHRVKARTGQIGVNSFLYEHGAEGLDAISWEAPDVVAVADGLTGDLVLQSYDVPPGGNRVLSYLDVVVADGTPIERIAAALETFGSMVPTKLIPLITVADGVGIRFGCEPGLPAFAALEFGELRGRVLDILRAERHPRNSDKKPIQIEVSFDDTGYWFELIPESAERVRAARGPGNTFPSKLQVKPDVMMNFQDLHGDLVPHVVAELTGLRLEVVIQMGGVVMMKPDGTQIRTWPLEAK